MRTIENRPCKYYVQSKQFVREQEMRVLLQYLLEHAPHARIVVNIRQVGGETLVHKAWCGDKIFVSVSRRPLLIGW